MSNLDSLKTTLARWAEAKGVDVAPAELARRFVDIEIRLTAMFLSQTVAQADPRGRSGWLGVALLLLGIIFSGTATLFSV